MELMLVGGLLVIVLAVVASVVATVTGTVGAVMALKEDENED